MYNYDVSSKNLNELVSLKNRVAVVTGGARGIGLAIAMRLAEAGASVVIGDLKIEQAEEAAKSIHEKHGLPAAGFELNVGDSNSIKHFFAQLFTYFDRLDILVNNAGIYPFISALDITDEDYDRLMNINQRGAFICTREAAKTMIGTGGGGVIINIVSTAAIKTAGNSTHYTASKHGVAGFTQGFARELGKQGVRVLAVAPTLVATPGVQELKNSSEDLKKGLESFAASLPMGRAAYPDDIARVVLFAATDLAMFMTGSILFVDGGEITF